MTTGSEGAWADRTDEELLQLHVDGDPHAFSELFRRHRHRLWAVALSTLRDPEEAADAVQDAMISAFRRAGSFRHQSAVTTWLHRIVVNASLDRIRRNKVRRADALPDDIDRDLKLASTEDLDEIVASSELRVDVAAALGQINPDQRAALVLVDMEGYSVEEAARMLGCAEGTIKSRCSRGRAKLAGLLAHVAPAR
ncbi:RNA polymerase sigma factor, sigma-70 family [Mycobacteroides abscessus subsp. abscessus]|nr:RNA polymerase sigma factor, sigma-70 family [Mycobacteroides abscessus subsp. abscessus]